MITRHRRARRLCVTALLGATIFACFVATPRADTPPKLLDDNRNDLTLEALETSAFNLAINLAGFNVDPLTFSYPPVIVSGRVLSHPKIHNLYLDDDWDGNNPDAPTSAQLDAFTKPSCRAITSTRLASTECTTRSSPGRTAAAFFARLCSRSSVTRSSSSSSPRISCEVGFDPIGPPGAFPAITGVPQTNDDTLYVIYLPRSMNIIDGGCDSLSGFHFFGAAPNAKFEFTDPLPIFFSQTFAYAVIPTACASGSPQQIPRRHHQSGQP